MREESNDPTRTTEKTVELLFGMNHTFAHYMSLKMPYYAFLQSLDFVFRVYMNRFSCFNV